MGCSVSEYSDCTVPLTVITKSVVKLVTVTWSNISCDCELCNVEVYKSASPKMVLSVTVNDAN